MGARRASSSSLMAILPIAMLLCALHVEPAQGRPYPRPVPPAPNKSGRQYLEPNPGPRPLPPPAQGRTHQHSPPSPNRKDRTPPPPKRNRAVKESFPFPPPPPPARQEDCAASPARRRLLRLVS
ncbi:hypothetical protein EJB05_31908 [Eragrostis curvula]|uniref:Extensin domain-containing protein n=1 Tax=Eragrostis curvula TaxID=38414 RepID=A0A5J9UFL3_9POAL|nr:hypothetical protein EJB05_31908 [Eragrostis curvula]